MILKVGGIYYEVKEVDGLSEDGDILGRQTYPECLIEVEASMNRQRKNQTIIHELLHAILDEAGYDEQDEDLVNRAAIVLHQVLVDNDFDFLREVSDDF